MKFALITGANGMDGSYLMEFLLTKNYIIYGLIRRSSYFNTKRIDHLRNEINLVYGDMTDAVNMANILSKIKLQMKDDDILEIYNLAAQSHVAVSFEVPQYTANTDAIGVLNILEAIRSNNLETRVKFYQASTSEMYGKVQEIPQTETTPFYPRSPYGVAKLYGHWITKNYRESYGMFACSGILFNHTSPRRGENFILRKISLGIGKILRNEEQYLYLGNLDTKRDIGSSKDYVKGMWMMLQQDVPDDYVLATGKQYSIREFVKMAFAVVNVNIKWRGHGLGEEGYDEETGRVYVKINEKYYRPCEVDTLLGNPQKALDILNWKPETTITQIITEMITNDI
jgi:GDPmannose 4,6-dehydratase